MSKPNVTPWFDGKVKPVHVGVYERQTFGRIEYSRWDGSDWHINNDLGNRPPREAVEKT